LEDARRRVLDLSEKYHIQVNPDALVANLTTGEQQRVEILKQLYRDANILILDEPTAVLTPQEVDSLCHILRRMADSGYAIVLITHKLEEALTWCDQIDVLRDGRLVNSLTAGSVDRAALAALMVGREVIFQYRRPASTCGEVVLSADGICAQTPAGRQLLDHVSLQVRCGEIVGVAGVAGNGQSALARVLAGFSPASAGQVLLSGHDISSASIEQRIRRGLSYIPDDRHRMGMLPEMSVAENLILKQTTQPAFGRPWKLEMKQVRQHAAELMGKYKIRTASVDAPMKALSGGNQQKVVLAREIELLPHAIVADQPTRGLDVGAIENIHRLLLDARAKGLGVLLISTELEEILSLSDRIVVMFAGRIVYETAGQDADLEQIGLAMAGDKVV
jgi:simple sugar transport system ATP-binding protein